MAAYEFGIMYFHPEHYCAFYIVGAPPEAEGTFAIDESLYQGIAKLSREGWQVVHVLHRADYNPPKVVVQVEVWVQREMAVSDGCERSEQTF